MFARGKTVRLGFVWSTSYSGSKISDLPVNERSETGTTTWKREGTEKRKKNQCTDKSNLHFREHINFLLYLVQ